jgi:hypothetical protein
MIFNLHMSIADVCLLIFHVQILLRQTLANNDQRVNIQIFDNIAEITQSISHSNLPRIFSQNEWSTIRSDSLRLIGEHVHVRAQIVTFNRPSLNGEKILIQRYPNKDQLTDAIMIDENRQFIRDLVDNTYYTISADRIRYLSQPLTRNYSVNFLFDTVGVEQIYLRYLQTSIKWKVRYDLILENNDTDSYLQAYADIRNDGSSSLIIDAAQLISGDINIRTYSSAMSIDENNYGDTSNYGGGQQTMSIMNAPSVVSPSEELAGLYIFSINQTFNLIASSNYILPMFRPTIDIERYGLIEKSFTRTNNHGYAKRAYRLRVPSSYLPKGQVSIRESDRLVGETFWPSRTMNETNEFNLGDDSDLFYSENIQLISRRQSYEANGYRLVLSTYTIQLRVVNRKQRTMNIDYRLRFSSQENLTLQENTSTNLLQVDGPTVSGVLVLDANVEQQIQFAIETQ